MTDAQLIGAIKDAALLTGNFTLRSGRTSRYYLDKYRFETQPAILAALAERMAAFVDDGVDRIAGPELGGVPLATALSLRTGRPMVLVRNQKKEYGTNQQIEGVLHAGERVLITEDIATTGGQAIEAGKLLRDTLGCTVTRIVAVIDRQEGAAEAMAAAGLPFSALFTKADLGIS